MSFTHRTRSVVVTMSLAIAAAACSSSGASTPSGDSPSDHPTTHADGGASIDRDGGPLGDAKADASGGTLVPADVEQTGTLPDRVRVSWTLGGGSGDLAAACAAAKITSFVLELGDGFLRAACREGAINTVLDAKAYAGAILHVEHQFCSAYSESGCAYEFLEDVALPPFPITTGSYPDIVANLHPSSYQPKLGGARIAITVNGKTGAARAAACAADAVNHFSVDLPNVGTMFVTCDADFILATAPAQSASIDVKARLMTCDLVIDAEGNSVEDCSQAISLTKASKSAAVSLIAGATVDATIDFTSQDFQ